MYCEYCKVNITGDQLKHSVSYEHLLARKQHLRRAEWYCATCNTQSRTKKEFEAHILSKKHLKGKVDYHCEKCDYKTSLSHLIKQHEATKKHQKNTEVA